MSDKIKIGNIGESLAADFLEEKGFEILERNYRYRHAEIDLIVRRNDWVLFVEVVLIRHRKYFLPVHVSSTSNNLRCATLFQGH